MADQNIQIGITTTADTSGAQQAEAAVKSMQAEVARSANTIEEAAQGPIKRHAEKTKDAAGQTKNWGMAANAMSYQMQDFSVQVDGGTSAITAFSQQAPQLIDGLRMAGVLTGGVGMAMMGVSAVLPVVMFGARELWSSFSSGAGEAKKKTDELFSRLNDAKKIYQEFEDRASEEREKSARESAARMGEAIAESHTKARIAGDTEAIQGTFATLTAQLDLVRERINLSRLENALQTATGRDVIRYSKEREESILRIYDTELLIASIARETALQKARSAATEAQEKFDALKEKNAPFYQEIAAQRAKVAELTQRLQVIESGSEINDLFGKMQDKAAQYQAVQQANFAKGQQFSPESIALDNEFVRLRSQYNDAVKSQPKNKADTAAELAVATESLKNMEGKADSIKDTIEAAASKVSDAMAAITSQKVTGAAQESIGGKIKATTATATAEQEIIAAAKQAIEIAGGAAANKKPQDGFPGFEDATGFSGKAGVKAIAGELNTLITDNTPDAKQAPQILQLIDSLKTALGLKDATIASSLDKLASSVKAATDRIKEIESKLDNSR